MIDNINKTGDPDHTVPLIPKGSWSDGIKIFQASSLGLGTTDVEGTKWATVFLGIPGEPHITVATYIAPATARDWAKSLIAYADERDDEALAAAEQALSRAAKGGAA